MFVNHPVWVVLSSTCHCVDACVWINERQLDYLNAITNYLSNCHVQYNWNVEICYEFRVVHMGFISLHLSPLLNDVVVFVRVIIIKYSLYSMNPRDEKQLHRGLYFLEINNPINGLMKWNVKLMWYSYIFHMSSREVLDEPNYHTTLLSLISSVSTNYTGLRFRTEAVPPP